MRSALVTEARNTLSVVQYILLKTGGRILHKLMYT